MRIVFIGGERVGLACLKRLKNVVAVFTHPSEKGVADYASFDEIDLPVYKGVDTEKIKEYNPDLIVVVSWSQIIPKEVFDICPCVGIHYSLLPERRGGAPLNWAIIDGLKRSGITLYFMDEGVDTGDIIAQKEFEILDTDTPRELLDKICILAPDILEENMEAIIKNKRRKQDESKATYTKRRKPEDGLIDWSKTEKEIFDFIRALSPPYPMAFTYINGEKIFLLWK